MPLQRKFTEQLQVMSGVAAQMASALDADALLFLVERPLDWSRIHEIVGAHTILLAGDTAEVLAGAADDFDTIILEMPEASVYERLTQALLEAVADELLTPGAIVIAAYSGFEEGIIDSVSMIRLDEHLGRLTASDLRQIETKVPFNTLKQVVDLAVDIGREGREGKPVGTLFVVGDHRKVLEYSKPMGFDPVRGYQRSERNLKDAKVREGVKEIAQMDGAFVVASDATVMAASQHLSAPPAAELNLSKGLGARHWAAAHITRATGAVAVCVSATSGTVRLFNNGEIVLRIEPLSRAMKWKGFDFEVTTPAERESPMG
ncbi:MAG: DNA integrity scanning protein DisA nucleotide-binding domain protein [Pirellulales bacterium]